MKGLTFLSKIPFHACHHEFEKKNIEDKCEASRRSSLGLRLLGYVILRLILSFRRKRISSFRPLKINVSFFFNC